MALLLVPMPRYWLPLPLFHRLQNSIYQNQYRQLHQQRRRFHSPLLLHLLLLLHRQRQFHCSPSRIHVSVCAQNAGRKATQLRRADQLRFVRSARVTTTKPPAHYRLLNAIVCYAPLTNTPSPVADDSNRNSFAPMVLCRSNSSSNGNNNRNRNNNSTKKSTRRPLLVSNSSSSGGSRVVRSLHIHAGAVLVASTTAATMATRNAAAAAAAAAS